MQRYDVKGLGIDGMTKHPKGNYVRWSDVESLINDMERDLLRLQELLCDAKK